MTRSTGVRRLLGSYCIAALLFSAGCGGGPAVIPVSGTATVDGKPLESGFLISFVPDKEKGNILEIDCSGFIGSDGKYSLSTDDRYNQYEGAPPGWYKVTISHNDDKPIPVNKKYQQSMKSDLSIEVKPDAPPGAYDLKFTK